MNNTTVLMDEKWTRLLLESIADGVFTLDKQGRITSWNPAMERISGYCAAEVMGQQCFLLGFNQCFGNPCPRTLSECDIFDKGTVDGKECMLRHKTGKDIPVIKSARLIKDETGDVKGIVESVTDLTELIAARKKVEEAEIRLGEKFSFHNLIGKSHEMQTVVAAIKSAAASEATVLLQGESGTGKEIIATAIHRNSPRASNALITVNCSALSESLLESELFGHVKGAYTGAMRDRTGRFEEADNGTVLLDEISEMSPFIQVKLLRVLQEREIERVGESKKRKINIRVIAATNKDLFHLVQTGVFREDLYYRLKVFPITIAPLCKRREDIPLLTDHFITLQNKKTGKQITGVSHPAMQILLDYPWPGNVRELENAIEHAFVLCDQGMIDLFDLPVEIRKMKYQPPVNPLSRQTNATHPRRPNATMTLTQEGLITMLHQCNWNKAEVARQAGVSRTAIWKYMKKWNIPLKKSTGSFIS